MTPMDPQLRADFLEGMSRASTFVAVATTNGEAGLHGVTVSSMTSVSADGDHPSLLICVHHQSPVATAILRNRGFCANLLGEGQRDVSNLFAGFDKSSREARFETCPWTPGPAGQPMITGAAANFECRLATSLMWESHFVIIGKATSVCLSGDPSVLLYGQRSYKRAVHIEAEE